MPSRTEVLTFLCLTFSILSSAINGIDMAFNVYAIPLKETFNLTQVQVEIAASMGSIGSGLCFLEALLTATLGYKATFLLTWIGMPVSSLIFSLLAIHNTFTHYRPLLIYLTQLSLSTTNCMACIVIFRLNVELYPKTHTGKIIGLLVGASSFGKIVFAGIIDLFFSNNLPGFFLTLALASAIAFSVCYLLLYWRLTENKQQADDEVCLNGKEEERNGLLKDPGSCTQEDPEVTLNDLLRSSFFHTTFWPSVVFYACSFACLNNITAIAVSVNMTHSLVSVYLISVVIFLTRLSFGFVFDRFSSELCGFVLLFVGYLTFSAAMLTGMVWFNAYSVYLIILCVGVGQGTGMTIYVSLFVVHFGRSKVGVLTALFYAALAAIQQIIQLLIGYFYDINIDNLGSSDLFCVGKDCFFWSFFFILILTLLVACTQAFNCVRVTCIPTRRKEYYNMEDTTTFARR